MRKLRPYRTNTVHGSAGGRRYSRSGITTHFETESGQARFWQIGLLIVAIVVLAFDVASPQVVKAQLSDRAKSAALDASQAVVRSAGTSYASKYDTVCDLVTRRLESYGATLIPPRPETLCPDVDLDGTVTFGAEKQAPSILLKYLGLRNYYRVRVDISVRYSGGL